MHSYGYKEMGMTNGSCLGFFKEQRMPKTFLSVKRAIVTTFAQVMEVVFI